MVHNDVMNRFFVSITAIFLLGFLAACEAAVPAQKIPALTFQHLAPLNLAVGKVEVTSKYKPPLAAPNVEHRFATPPAKALRTWANDRLRPAGGAYTARLVILDASVTETKLKTRKGITGAFYIEQSERYDAVAEADLIIVDGSGAHKGFASTRASRSVTVSENASLAERERTQFELVESLMRDFDLELEKNIRRYLVNWIR